MLNKNEKKNKKTNKQTNKQTNKMFFKNCSKVTCLLHFVTQLCVRAIDSCFRDSHLILFIQQFQKNKNALIIY